MVNQELGYVVEKLRNECDKYLEEFGFNPSDAITEGDLVIALKKDFISRCPSFAGDCDIMSYISKETLRARFVLKLIGFMSNEENMLCLDGNSAVSEYAEDITLDEIFQYNLDDDDSSIETQDSVAKLLVDFCNYLVF